MSRPQWFTFGFCCLWTLVYCGGLVAWEVWAFLRWGIPGTITETIRTLRAEYGWIPGLLFAGAMLMLGGLVVHFAQPPTKNPRPGPPA